jgi:hypothetical protein
MNVIDWRHIDLGIGTGNHQLYLIKLNDSPELHYSQYALPVHYIF